MSVYSRHRGEPLIALMLILGGWVSVRAVQLQLVDLPVVASLPVIVPLGIGVTTGVMTATSPSPLAADVPDRARAPSPADRGERRRRIAPLFPPRGGAGPASHAVLPAPVPVRSLAPLPDSGPVTVAMASSHQLLWMAAMARLPLPDAVLSSRTPSGMAAGGAPTGTMGAAPSRRWSGDGWLLWRRGGLAALAGGAVPATYGASQTGAVVRYRLSPGSEHRPAAYLRASSALEGLRDRQAALGLSARPLARVPVTLAIEARAIDQRGGTRVVPAAFAYTDLAPADMPGRLRVEAYGQAGYVGGRNATAFADGQVRLGREIARIGKTELRAGGGAWGGAQKGASRLDIGPGATLGAPIGEAASARVAFDWRFRIAGTAAPRSGPALTLSAGF